MLLIGHPPMTQPSDWLKTGIKWDYPTRIERKQAAQEIIYGAFLNPFVFMEIIMG